jgi:hypothetical protein
MFQRLRFASPWLAVPALLLFVTISAQGQARPEPTRRLITEPLDENRWVKLPGNTRPEANPQDDRGRVPDSLPMDHLELTLRLPEEKNRELQRYLRDVQDSQSPEYHRWLTPQQFNERFSPAPGDVQTIANWLRAEGFRVDAVAPRSIDFSGTAGQVERAFGTEIHYLEVAGVRHIANMSDPEIPAAFAPAVSGIASLNDFRPRPLDRGQASK